MTVSQSIAFIHELTWADLSVPVRKQARRCLLDTVGAAIAGRRTPLSQIIHNHAAASYGGAGAHLWLDGRQVSPPGAALANGMTIDALDIHDGFNLTKGHAGAAIVPALLATANLIESENVTGMELMASLVVGYEIALRAGLALHGTACDYHTSGAWNALGCAAITARRLRLDTAKTSHALGIAEYHGPRSQMMRCIDHPTMLKDGSGWGAMAGVSAGLMAGGGFTGAPAVTVTDPDVSGFWSHLGTRWLITEQYFKPYAVCRWAQPAITAALALRAEHGLDANSIRRVRVRSFHEAIRLTCRQPLTTEEAQYSTPFSVAAALVRGQVGPDELSGAALTDPAILRLSDMVELIESPEYNAQFPGRRLARVIIETADGRILTSDPTEPGWDAASPPSDDALREKFHWLAGQLLSETHITRLERLIWRCDELGDATELAASLAAPPTTVTAPVTAPDDFTVN